MKSTQMTPYFSSHFSFLPACNIHFWISKYLKFNFKFITSVHSGLYNISIFRQKLLMRTTHHTFIESRHPEVTTNLLFFAYLGEQNTHFLCSSSWTILEVEENFILSLCAFLWLFWWQKKLLRALLTCTFIRLLLSSFNLRSYSSK